ncbi:MAG: hypothetical protein F4Z01_07750 [Gammaproteobacteria bacterium]|nr:hypothetical protein [Gammaproteobacteria bacterium]MYF39221.1 hypothetical protein [Gammaproteobacteria bacterium]
MKIYFDPRLGPVHDLIAFSDTLVSVRESFSSAENYRPNAKLPVDFRQLDEFEIQKFTGTLDELSLEDELNFVAIFPCDPECDRTLDFTPFMSLSPINVLNASVDSANSPSITVDRATGLKLGLHLDTWDDHDVHSRWKSRNRIVVNRGPGDRYVYLILMPIEEMAQSIESSNDLHPCEVADEYIRQSESNTPCLRICQRPSVAYVGCTERLVHDACVSPLHEKAESRHYLGHFVKN